MSNYVDPHPGLTGDATVQETCHRCGGMGVFSTYGRCFTCRGTGAVTRKVRNVRAAARRAARKEEQRREDAEQRRRDAEEARRRFMMGHGDVVTALEALAGEFADSMRQQLEDRGTLTEKQCTAILASARELELLEDALPVPDGKEVVTGTVSSVRVKETLHGLTLKMVLLEDRGFKLYGTVPAALREDLEPRVTAGNRVQFTATISPSRDSEFFGFYRRPTGGRILT